MHPPMQTPMHAPIHAGTASAGVPLQEGQRAVGAHAAHANTTCKRPCNLPCQRPCMRPCTQALQVLEFLCKKGSEPCVPMAAQLLPQLAALGSFHYVGSDQGAGRTVDYGVNVRLRWVRKEGGREGGRLCVLTVQQLCTWIRNTTTVHAHTGPRQWCRCCGTRLASSCCAIDARVCSALRHAHCGVPTVV